MHAPPSAGSSRRPHPRKARLRRTILALPATLLLAACAAMSLPAGAGAVEAGLALPGPEVGQTARAASVGAHWVRMFMPWAVIEPGRGSYAQNWLTAYEQSFRGFPAGTKFILDVVGTPPWETGSSDQRTPPADPADYARMLRDVAGRFGPRVAAYEIWNEEDEPRWWAGRPGPGGLRRAC